MNLFHSQIVNYDILYFWNIPTENQDSIIFWTFTFEEFQFICAFKNIENRFIVYEQERNEMLKYY